jgi:hypothetical protein
MSARGWRAAYVIVAAAFLATAATYYHPGAGFTAFIEFPASTHDSELPRVRDTPHYDHAASGGYDGQFYAQIALDPLLQDPAIDRALDNPPYRARRILFSWTAYAIGLGRPYWVLQVYALQNVICWLAMAWLLCRWMPPASARNFALWCGCLLSPGFLSSVRYALPDAPSTTLLAAGLAINAATLGAGVIGLAALGRETAIFGAGRIAELLWQRRWFLAVVCALLCVAPLALWLDYLRSIYRDGALAGGDHIAAFWSGIGWKIARIRAELLVTGLNAASVASALAMLAFFVQAGVVTVAVVRSRGRDRWALTAAGFILLALFTHREVYAGSPGAFTRVFLPVTIAANVLLASQRSSSWLWIAGANLAAIPSVLQFAERWR